MPASASQSNTLVTDEVLAGLVRGLADAVVIADAEGTIVFWNDGAASAYGAGSVP